MLEENRQARQASAEAKIGILSYERFRLCREIDRQQRRITEIDALLENLEGILRENEHMRLDLSTQVSIDQATGGEQHE